MKAIEDRLSKYGYSIGNPRDDKSRGGHVCLEHEEAYRISQALRDHGLIPDFREPNVIRLAPVPLYTSFSDLDGVMDILEKVSKEEIYKDYSHKRETVV